MLNWLNEVAGPGFAQAVLWTGLALLLLIVLLVIVKLVRSMTFGTFVAGGRNRKARLAVMDAAAVDSHRRLVLVRRDDVEHLLLIGGPTDVVVERDIRHGMQPRRPAPAGDASLVDAQQQLEGAAPQVPSSPRARPPEPPRPSLHSSPVPRPPAERLPAPVPPPAAEPARMPPLPSSQNAAQRPESSRPATTTTVAAHASSASSPRIETRPQGQPATRLPVSPATPPKPASLTAPTDDLDSELLKELEVSLDDNGASSKPTPTRSLDDEMSKLLGELSNPRR